MPSPLIIPPRAELAPWIHHILVMHFQEACLSRLPAALSPAILIFARGAGWLSDSSGRYRQLTPRAKLAGPRFSPGLTYTEPGTSFISILFRPGLMAEALGPGVGELRDHAIPLDAIFSPARVRMMLERIDEDPSPTRWADHVQELLLASLREEGNARRIRSELGEASRLFEPAARLAADLGIGLRQFERRIDRAYGATLRDMRRMARFGFSLPRLLSSSRARGQLARIAHDFGYYDQSHMDRDFVALTGFSPTELLDSSSGSDPGFWVYRFAKGDFQTLFLSDDVDSIQETIFSRA